ncbi:MAG: hypothetical protein QOH61_2315 [Chloroflexota bacterium]|jgi:hypothetical protein|nr:hypothetical protein [Chloroflexota bacterium]
MGLTTLEPTATVDDVCAVIERDGGVIVRDMAGSALIDRVLAELDPYLMASKKGQDRFTGFETTRTNRLLGRSRSCGDLVMHPLFLETSERVLQPHEGIQIGGTQGIRVGPGSAAQSLHRDDGGRGPRAHPGPDSELTIIYAGTDFTEENGATWVIPGSHKWDDQRKPSRSEAVQAVMPKGSALMWLGSVYHGAGENRTADEFRIGLLFLYMVGYLRQEENQYLSVPLEMVKQYPERLQRLLGYSLYGRFTGYIDWMEDPHQYLLEH